MIHNRYTEIELSQRNVSRDDVACAVFLAEICRNIYKR
jgi:hypothetical protein